MKITQSRNKREGVYMPGRRIMFKPGNMKRPNLRTGKGNGMAMARHANMVMVWAVVKWEHRPMKVWEF